MSHLAKTASHPEAIEHADHSLIMPVTGLRDRALAPGTQKDLTALLEKAEKALEVLKPQFEQWMDEEIARLDNCLAAYVAEPGDDQRNALYRVLHDIRGNAAVFGQPLVGRIADNLCRFFDAVRQVPSDLVVAHVQAMHAMLREQATSLDHPVGAELASVLELVTNVVEKRMNASET